jgi:hypothetical protein
MSLQEIIYRGSLISTGAAQVVSIPAGFDQFVLRNRTTLAAGAGIIESKYWLGMANATAETKTVAGGAITDAIIVANGFTYVDDSTNQLSAPNATTTAISQAAAAIVSLTSTAGLNAGDVIRFYSTTGMLQIAGMDFSIDTIVANTSFRLPYLNSAGFGAAGTAGTFRRVAFANNYKFYPSWRYITGITAAAQAVVTFSVTHQYVVGQKLSLRIPTAFGMTQMNGLTGTVVAINTTTNTVTLDIDSSAFTAFAFPTSATAAAGVSFPIAVPAGESATILTGAERDIASRSILIGSAICGTLNDVMDYWAYRSET